MDARRLREVTPAKRGWRFVGRHRGKILRANVPYLVIIGDRMTRHYTESGARKRLAILATSGVTAAAVMWDEDRWLPITTAGVTLATSSIRDWGTR